MRWSGHRDGFTLIELLVVIAIIVILAALLWPATPRHPESRSMACLSNVKQLALGVLMYAQDYGQRMPPADRWAHSIYPYVKHRGLFSCPSDDAARTKLWRGSYGMSHSLSSGEVETVPDPAARPMLWDADPHGHFVRRHGEIGTVAFVDGHAKLHPGGLAGMDRGWVDAPE